MSKLRKGGLMKKSQLQYGFVPTCLPHAASHFQHRRSIHPLLKQVWYGRLHKQVILS